MKKRIIKLFGEVNQEMANYVFEQILEILKENENSLSPHNEDIIILINSPKGNILHGAAIHDILQMIPNKKIGIIIGYSSDATNHIFLSCSERYISKNSIVYFF